MEFVVFFINYFTFKTTFSSEKHTGFTPHLNEGNRDAGEASTWPSPSYTASSRHRSASLFFNVMYFNISGNGNDGFTAFCSEYFTTTLYIFST